MTVNLSTNLAYLGDITATNIIRVLPTRWRHEPAGIDIGRNYATVTLRILLLYNEMIARDNSVTDCSTLLPR